MCMCCDCCCGPLRAFKGYPKPAEMVNSSFYARVREDDCTGCALCEDRCPMDAVTVEDTASVDLDRCIGCGLCAVTCPADAIKIHRKDREREFVPEPDVLAATRAIYEQRRAD